MTMVFHRRLLLTLFGLAVVHAELFAGRPATVADMMAVRNVPEARISPDGRQVVYVVSVPDMKSNLYRSDLFLVPTQGGEPRQLTQSGKRDDQPRWSPNGGSIAFRSNRSGTAQVWLIDPTGGEARQLTDAKSAVNDFAWSPDGTRIAYTATEPETDEEKKFKEEKGDVRLVDQNLKRDRLHVIELVNKKSRVLTPPEQHVLNFDWSPNGEEIAYSHRAEPGFTNLFQSDLAVVAAPTGKLRPLVVRDGLDSLPRWSPDGKHIAFVSHGGKLDWIGNATLAVVPAAGGEPRAVGSKFDESVSWWSPEAYRWTHDGKGIYFTGPQGIATQLFRLTLSTGDVRQITKAERIHDFATFSKEQDRLALLIDDPREGTNVFTLSLPAGEPQRLTTVNPQLAELDLADVEVVRWKAKDGLELEGLLYKPADFKKGRRYPLLTYIHGGPSGYFQKGFVSQRWNPSQAEPYPLHVLTGQGFVIFCPNIRGSGAYGIKFRHSNVKDWGFGDYQDFMAGLEYLVAQGVADPERLGIMGWSYGGYMTMWTIGQTTRFKAASAGAGVSNLVSMYGQTDIQPFMERYFDGPSFLHQTLFTKHSPMTYAGRMRTPTLIQHGEQDVRVPLAQSRELYIALKRQGVPVEFAVYPRQGHVISEPKLQADLMQRNVDWFTKWLGPSTGK